MKSIAIALILIAAAKAAVRFARITTPNLQTLPQSREGLAVRLSQHRNCLLLSPARPFPTTTHQTPFSVRVMGDFKSEQIRKQAFAVERVDHSTMRVCFDKARLGDFCGEVRVEAALQVDGVVLKRRLIFWWTGAVERTLTRKGKVWLHLEPCVVVKRKGTVTVKCDNLSLKSDEQLVVMTDYYEYIGAPGTNTIDIHDDTASVTVSVRSPGRLIEKQYIAL